MSTTGYRAVEKHDGSAADEGCGRQGELSLNLGIESGGVRGRTGLVRAMLNAACAADRSAGNLNEEGGLYSGHQLVVLAQVVHVQHVRAARGLMRRPDITRGATAQQGKGLCDLLLVVIFRKRELRAACQTRHSQKNTSKVKPAPKLEAGSAHALTVVLGRICVAIFPRFFSTRAADAIAAACCSALQ